MLTLRKTGQADMEGKRRLSMFEGFERLEVWQHSHHLVLQIYKVTNQFPGQSGLV